MNCLAHLLNLVVNVLFESAAVLPLLVKCRKLVGTFKHSTTLSEKLANTIGRLNTTAARPLYDDEDEGVDLEFGLENLALRVEVQTEQNLSRIW